MKQISVSILDSYRRMVMGLSDYDTEENFISMLKGEGVTSDKMTFGTGCHNIVAGDFSVNGKEAIITTIADGKELIFTPEQADTLTHLISTEKRPVTTFELPMHGEYNDIVVSLRLDAFDGSAITDFKFTHRKVSDMNKWIDSLQWRYYLDISGASSFVYQIVEVSGFKDLSKSDMTEVKFKVLEPMEIFGYKEIHKECRIWVKELSNYLTEKGLWDLIKEKQVYYEF